MHLRRLCHIGTRTAGHPADVSAVLAMMRLLWEGHRDRHEGGPTTTPITPESAQAAVSIAITLVHLLSTDSIRTPE